MPETQAQPDQSTSKSATSSAAPREDEQPTKPEPIARPNKEFLSTVIKGSNSSILTASELPFGTIGIAAIYRVLPARLADSAQGHTLRWRIELHGLSRDVGPVGLDIVGDVILGRGTGAGEAPDLDLDPFGAFDTGVSRQHAILRPSRNALYLIDLNSTNGTWHNALRLGSGTTRALGNNDTVTLGRLTFTIRLISLPPQPKLQNLSDVEPASPSNDAKSTSSKKPAG